MIIRNIPDFSTRFPLKTSDYATIYLPGQPAILSISEAFRESQLPAPKNRFDV
jgi:hypothetical protein